jgi:hypothetical protein
MDHVENLTILTPGALYTFQEMKPPLVQRTIQSTIWPQNWYSLIVSFPMPLIPLGIIAWTVDKLQLYLRSRSCGQLILVGAGQRGFLRIHPKVYLENVSYCTCTSATDIIQEIVAVEAAAVEAGLDGSPMTHPDHLFTVSDTRAPMQLVDVDVCRDWYSRYLKSRIIFTSIWTPSRTNAGRSTLEFSADLPYSAHNCTVSTAARSRLTRSAPRVKCIW